MLYQIVDQSEFYTGERRYAPEPAKHNTIARSAGSIAAGPCHWPLFEFVPKIRRKAKGVFSALRISPKTKREAAR
jgi:hypothetical protein